MRIAVLASLALTLAAACSDDAPATDAAVDAPPDAGLDAPGCGADVFLTGEYVDWDSTTTDFHGVFEARWTVRGPDATRTILSNPNGRVELCIVPSAVSIIDVTKTGYLPGVFVADPAVYLPAGPTFSSRGLTTSRANTFYESLAIVFDPTKAHVLVHQHAPQAIALTGGGTAFAVDNGDDTTWTAGSTGGLVLFANVDVGTGTATLSAPGSFVGPTTLPLVAGTLTMTSIR